jgi:Xaa-Pro aminopeptidase
LLKKNSLHKKRLAGACAGVKAQAIDALLVTGIENIRYLTGFTGGTAYVIVTPHEGFLLTDPRYSTQVRTEVRGYRVRIYKKAIDAIVGIIIELRAKKVGFEANNLSFEAYAKIKKGFNNKKALLSATTGIVEGLRIIKDQAELDIMREAARLGDLGFEEARRRLSGRTGRVTEREVAIALEFAMLSNGAEGPAFDTIVASGVRSALPHGKATQKEIKKGELIVIDAGARASGYNSDETRTYSIGRPTAEQKRVYSTVLTAQSKAIDGIRHGVKASLVDAIAREHIRRAGFGRYFGHGTGHGVGLQVHEGPQISPKSKDVLEQGMVITVEPGIYIPGWGGVRIEDTVAVERDGCEVLTKSTRGLVSL